MAGSIYDISVARADGGTTKLSDYADKVMLIVNVASKCGFTKQYDALEVLFSSYRSKGFVVLGFPANDFAGQEPGTDAAIQDFLSSDLRGGVSGVCQNHRQGIPRSMRFIKD